MKCMSIFMLKYGMNKLLRSFGRSYLIKANTIQKQMWYFAKSIFQHESKIMGTMRIVVMSLILCTTGARSFTCSYQQGYYSRTPSPLQKCSMSSNIFSSGSNRTASYCQIRRRMDMMLLRQPNTCSNLRQGFCVSPPSSTGGLRWMSFQKQRKPFTIFFLYLPHRILRVFSFATVTQRSPFSLFFIF